MLTTALPEIRLCEVQDVTALFTLYCGNIRGTKVSLSLVFHAALILLSADTILIGGPVRAGTQRVRENETTFDRLGS